MSLFTTFAITTGVTCLISAGITRWLITRPALFASILDHPNARSLHQQPIPRTGGIAIFIAILFGGGAMIAIVPPLTNAQMTRSLVLCLAVLLVGGVSFLDDWRQVARRYRLLIHCTAALLVYSANLAWDYSWLPGSTGLMPSFIALPLTLLFIIWMINLYNFMDGMDGFASSQAIIGFSALAILGIHAGDWVFTGFSLVIIAAALGFLTGNFPPARIFLGDLGASLFGLLAAVLILWGANDGLFSLWIGALAFSPFIVDATWTLLRRAMHREPIWNAHRSHHYQRLVLSGWSHRKTLLASYPIIIAAAATAVAAVSLAPIEQWQLLFGWAGIYSLIHLKVRFVERHHSSSPNNP
ncbi:MraY family glycosyltransferase [Thiospirillum jenense]|uniref:Glycosyltransferase family 4 protein n=1 Tax=Thiospirillum jenense TaxID=1653858 RepID=A0A839HAX0_9GAMM|nr:glycosyltransferase family 4 protein [Thiospirillum jenense]MBB1126193.1 glycosyltransferase family 4 protein [Thiospirillum jenense]